MTCLIGVFVALVSRYTLAGAVAGAWDPGYSAASLEASDVLALAPVTPAATLAPRVTAAPAAIKSRRRKRLFRLPARPSPIDTLPGSLRDLLRRRPDGAAAVRAHAHPVPKSSMKLSRP